MSVGNLGGFFGPILMGELKTQTHGGYEAGLYTAAGLMVPASLPALRTLRPAVFSAPSSAEPSGVRAQDPRSIG